MKKDKLFKSSFVILVLLISYSFSFNKREFTKDDLLHIWILDVGQGDSILMKTPDEKYILIDANGNVLGKLTKFFPTGACKLDLVVLTHPHFDHFSGLDDIVSQCQIVTYAESTAEAESKSYLSLEHQVSEASRSGGVVDVREVEASDSFEFGEIKLSVLWPEKSAEDYSNFNNASVVILGSYQSFDFLLTGDAEQRVYDEILENHPKFPVVEVLKYPHHGSQDGYNAEFFGKIDPKVSIISVGEGNKYGHPSQFVIDSLETLGSSVYRTDLHGTIEVITDGNTFKVYTER